MAKKCEYFYIADMFWDTIDGELHASILNEKKGRIDFIDILGEFKDEEDAKQSLLEEASYKGYLMEKFLGFLGDFLS